MTDVNPPCENSRHEQNQPIDEPAGNDHPSPAVWCAVAALAATPPHDPNGSCVRGKQLDPASELPRDRAGAAEPGDGDAACRGSRRPAAGTQCPAAVGGVRAGVPGKLACGAGIGAPRDRADPRGTQAVSGLRGRPALEHRAVQPCDPQALCRRLAGAAATARQRHAPDPSPVRSGAADRQSRHGATTRSWCCGSNWRREPIPRSRRC